MPDLLWLLLPVAAASGWWMARRGGARRQEGSSSEFTSDYLKGLNYLLNEQTDKAIEVFIHMLEVNSDTVETHLALGSLFRRRGEVDRAIRIHQNLIARPTLSREQRAQALLELAEDYMRAGLLDRAENLFLELIEMNLYGTVALWSLIDIYQQEKDWDKAIAVAQRLESETGKSMAPTIAQYYCELAAQAWSRRERERAMQMTRRALASDWRCVRASILEAELFAAEGDDRNALGAYRRVQEQDLEFVPEVIDAMVACYSRLGRADQLIDVLQGLVREYPAVKPTLALAESLRSRQGEHDALEFIVASQRQHPSLPGLNWLLKQELEQGGEDEDVLRMLSDLTEHLVGEMPGYHCRQCGFQGKSLHWQCPSCKSWNTVKPISGIDAES